MDCKLWYLERFDLTKTMREEEIRNMEKSILRRELKKNAVIRFPGGQTKYVYLLQTGLVKIATSNKSGKETIKYLVKPGNLFGEIPLLGEYEHLDDYAVAVEDSVICFIEAGKLREWMRKNKELYMEVLKQIGRRLKRAENRLRAMIFKDARTRIAEFLIDFALEFGTPRGKSYEVKNFLTQDDIAKLTATSRQTVSSTLNDLRQEKLIDYSERLIRVHFSCDPPLRP